MGYQPTDIASGNPIAPPPTHTLVAVNGSPAGSSADVKTVTEVRVVGRRSIHRCFPDFPDSVGGRDHNAASGEKGNEDSIGGAH
ncbi:hypothetical protein Bca4012_010402 [Brassica carinata]|uniref:Uncharacterized protein n=1 Tax=Brassica carinata TaxID=52824 RepID=A0A8X7S558_BRACI|nr:hypothetical protein Bca52824_035342 [Brassica carinata]